MLQVFGYMLYLQDMWFIIREGWRRGSKVAKFKAQTKEQVNTPQDLPPRLLVAHKVTSYFNLFSLVIFDMMFVCLKKKIMFRKTKIKGLRNFTGTTRFQGWSSQLLKMGLTSWCHTTFRTHFLISQPEKLVSFSYKTYVVSWEFCIVLPVYYFKNYTLSHFDVL